MNVSKLRVGEQYDRRRKLTEEDKFIIKALRKRQIPYRELAHIFGVAIKTVYLVCYPTKADDYRGDRKEYTKKERAEIKRKHTAYKNNLFAEGKIK